jgi:hypothetical protein
MNNPYCISNILLKELWEDKNKDRLDKQILNFKGLSVSELTSQMEKDAGTFYEAMVADTSKFTTITENVEILVATDLSGFYFPGFETEVCFEMRSNFKAPKNISYDDIVTGLESNTHIDCSIRSNEKQFDFQIKRYSQKHFSFTSEVMTEYIKNVIKSYGDMKGTILIIVLQPDTQPKEHFNFKEIHKNISTIKDKVSFNEINFLFNDENQQIVWWQVFPLFGLANKPLIFKSQKYQKVQEKMKTKFKKHSSKKLGYLKH